MDVIYLRKCLLNFILWNKYFQWENFFWMKFKLNLVNWNILVTKLKKSNESLWVVASENGLGLKLNKLVKFINLT